MSCRLHDRVRPVPPFEGDPRDCAFPTGWGRRSRPPEPPRPWWGAWLGVLFVLIGGAFSAWFVWGICR